MVDTPTPTELKTRYPEFAGVADTYVTAVIDEAKDFVTDEWLERDQKKAVMSLACHNMSLEGEPARSNGDLDLVVPQGQLLKRRKVGDVEVELAEKSSTVAKGSTGSVADQYATTSYGQVYWRLLKLNNRGFRSV